MSDSSQPMMQTTHYSAALMPSVLLNQVRERAEGFAQWLSRNGLDSADVIIVYSGMSGVAYATAILLELYRSHNILVNAVYVRKPDEKSHGSTLEFGSVGTGINYRLTPFKHAVFVDDFISTGTTLARCFRKCMEYQCARREGAPRVEYVRRPFDSATVWSTLTRGAAAGPEAPVVDGKPFPLEYTLDSQGA